MVSAPRVVNYTITQTVIKTSFRMTYSCHDILAGDEEKDKSLRKLFLVSNLMAKHERLESMREKRVVFLI